MTDAKPARNAIGSRASISRGARGARRADAPSRRRAAARRGEARRPARARGSLATHPTRPGPPPRRGPAPAPHAPGDEDCADDEAGDRQPPGKEVEALPWRRGKDARAEVLHEVCLD